MNYIKIFSNIFLYSKFKNILYITPPCMICYISPLPFIITLYDFLFFFQTLRKWDFSISYLGYSIYIQDIIKWHLGNKNKTFIAVLHQEHWLNVFNTEKNTWKPQKNNDRQTYHKYVWITTCFLSFKTIWHPM